MPKRRGNNEGTLHKRSSGSWRASVSVDGRRIWRTFKNKREAQAWLRQTLEEIDQGLSFDGSQTSLNEFMSKWLVSIKSSIRPNTHKQYQQITNQHILPSLGKYRLREIKPDQIQYLYDRKVESGTGLRTVQLVHAVLHRCFVHAVKLGAIPRNPAAATTPPKPKPKEMKFYDENQVQTMLIASKANHPRMFPLLHLAVSTGMRQGELLGLKWPDLEWESGQLHIQRQLSRAEDEGYELTIPKTKAGIRKIDLGANTSRVLREHQQRQNQEINKVGGDWHDNNLIFPSTIGTFGDRDNLRKHFKDLLNEAGLPEIRFHDLRHTAAALMLSNGGPVIVVSRRLGHARPSITLDIYGHLIPQKQKAATDLMDRLLTPVEVRFEDQLRAGTIAAQSE